jgi:ATP-dependent DNA helicase RecQ
LRVHFPDRPIAAFTASATRRVRHDILNQLQLRSPAKYIASFHRANLRYVVRECEGRSQLKLLLAALANHAGDNIIVYAPTIVRVEETVDFLEEEGIPAIAYHGKMETDLRRRNQESWMADEVRVLVGTIAFGLGINKASVRSVIHLSLPKSIEQYYQEAGRAGRDGLPADCVLLWQKRDAGLLAHFIGQVVDPAEKERAWERYHTIRRFVDSNSCRHRQICLHFGETPKWTECGACDVCSGTPEWLSETEAKRSRPSLIPVERPGRATSPAALDFDPELREYLRQWRSTVANQEDVPAFVVMHDTSLAEICRKRPTSLAEIRGVSGFGERKTERYGQQILDALERFRKGERAAAVLGQRSKPVEDTVRLLAEGRSFEEIAKIRGRQLKSVIDLVAGLVEKGELQFQNGWVDDTKRTSIEEACSRLGMELLKPLKEALPPEITYEEIRLVAARLRREQQKTA